MTQNGNVKHIQRLENRVLSMLREGMETHFQKLLTEKLLVYKQTFPFKKYLKFDQNDWWNFFRENAIHYKYESKISHESDFLKLMNIP